MFMPVYVCSLHPWAPHFAQADDLAVPLGSGHGAVQLLTIPSEMVCTFGSYAHAVLDRKIDISHTNDSSMRCADCNLGGPNHVLCFFNDSRRGAPGARSFFKDGFDAEKGRPHC